MNIGFLGIEILGWVGMLLIVVAYLLVSIKKLEASANLYQAMNLMGSLGIGVHVYYQKAWPALTLEVVWSTIAIWAMIANKKS